MRILYCNKYNFAFSGTEVYLFEAMDLMRSQGHEVALFSMTDPRGERTNTTSISSQPSTSKPEGPGLRTAPGKQPARCIHPRRAGNYVTW